ncbi:hypothetical protein L226DRAFT_17927 [Lentinus tigrinus ALCF2SS1-7]|uniref:G-protein coupled receptors family 1 profile domain-containing protein n=1 Tax=Lentinus tigrinus ALCF2SS1-6 TaxID=1328759 RepID=A0A5C2SPQ2_9APHY|nr:hypothetical protein L227DRAFT_278388 [Lentinus tigrinus ALCF2SS1-6]RPD82162.1 hypothetical protein L226DRAFT_17927 [Lentinus tigrinus ALCF2SS1-7]
MYLPDSVPVVRSDDDPAHHKMYSQLGVDASALINACFVLTTVGQFALLFLGATLLLSRRVHKRSAALKNLLVTTFLSTIPPYLLMYAGSIWDPRPPFRLCVTQAALVDATGVMFSIASLALVVDLMLEIRAFSLSNCAAHYRNMMLVTAPYTVFFAFSISALALGIIRPDIVRHMPDDLSCSLRNTPLSIAMQITIVLTLTAALCLEVYAIVDTLRARHDLTDLRRPSLLTVSQAVRIVGFTCLQVFLLIVSALDIYLDSPALHVASIIYQALIPLATFVIFGMTRDCINAWKALVTFAKHIRSRTTRSPVTHFHVEVTIEKEKWNGDSDPFARLPITPIRVPLDGLSDTCSIA